MLLCEYWLILPMGVSRKHSREGGKCGVEGVVWREWCGGGGVEGVVWKEGGVEGGWSRGREVWRGWCGGRELWSRGREVWREGGVEGGREV